MNNSDTEVVGSDCMCELGSDKHKEGCEYSTHSTKEAYQNTIEEFKGMVWHSRLKAFDRATNDEEEQDHSTEMFISWLEQALKATREEAVREERKRIKEWIEDKPWCKKWELDELKPGYFYLDTSVCELLKALTEVNNE